MQRYIEVDLFNGIGGFSLATRRKGLNVIKRYVSEIDKFANKCYFENFKAEQLGDISLITKEKIIEINEYAKKHNAKILLAVGSPCQDLSLIGRGLGLDGGNKNINSLSDYITEKNNGTEFLGTSHLFYEAVRIKELLDYDFVLFENVRMTKVNKDKFDSELGMNHIYIDSREVSPQSRKRLYWSNSNYIPEPFCGKVTNDILENDIFIAPPKYMRGLDQGKQRFTKCSNVSGKCHTLVYSMYKGNRSSFVRNDDGLLHKLTPLECERLQGFNDNYTSMLSNTQRFKTLGNSFNIPSIMGFLNGYLNNYK